MKPVVARLEELLKKEDANAKPVLFAEDCLDAQKEVDSLVDGQALVLENVRFYKNESSKVEEERMIMAKKLATYGDVFVSDAFGTAHRNAASGECNKINEDDTMLFLSLCRLAHSTPLCFFLQSRAFQPSWVKAPLATLW